MSHDTALHGLFQRPRHGAGLMQRLRDFARPLPRQGLDRLAAARDAAAVREMAWRMQSSDPALASDLLAAADRHQRQFDAAR